MRHYTKGYVYFLLAAVIFMSSISLPVYGASNNREKINSVKLTVICQEKPEVGKEVGQVDVTVSDGKIEVTEPAEYYNTEDDVWIRGETPLIQVKISVKDPDKYYFTSSTKVTVSGNRSEFKSKKVKDGGDSLLVQIQLSKVTGDLDEVEDYYWDEKDARWSDVEDADSYEVRLYRGNSSVVTVTTKKNNYDFYPYMNKAGEYSFKVRGISSSDGVKGPWSDRSEEHYISADAVWSPNAGWNQNGSGWMYYGNDGQLVKESWLYVDNNWFYLGSDGYMKTGWLYVDNNWFYLNPVSDGTKGAMKTDWIYVNNNWYYLNPVSDGTRGAMKKEYQLVNGKWYYLDPASGVLWANRYVPDGRYADGSGAIR